MLDEIEMLQYLPYFWNTFLFDTITYVELFLSKVQCQAELSHIHKLYILVCVRIFFRGNKKFAATLNKTNDSW